MGQIIRLGDWRQELARTRARRRIQRNALLPQERPNVPQLHPADLRDVIAQMRRTVIRLEEARAAIAQYQHAAAPKAQW